MLPSDSVRDYTTDLRPDKWDEVCGQGSIVRCLRHYCATGRPPKAIAFVGPFGSGKSTLARLTAMSLACSGRNDGDPEPCGRCESCLGFSGAFHTFETMVIPPHASAADFRFCVRSVKDYPGASMFAVARRPVPVYIDDLDEHPKSHQQHLKHELDGRWCGVVLAATTKPKSVEPGLLDRFQVFCLMPSELQDLLAWIRRIGVMVGAGVIGNDVAASLARHGGMNPRDILKLMQLVHAAGLGYTAGGVGRAALMMGTKA
jgi:DNA polymerase-3 subunit gamma/tau